MSGKSKIKHDVFRPNFFGAVRAIPKLAGDGKTVFIPKPEKRDKGATIANARYVIEDTGVRMHAFNNVHSLARNNTANNDADDDAQDENFDVNNPTAPARPTTGFTVESLTGAALMQFVLAPVRRAFRAHDRIKTFIMVMDKGIFMPRPKTYVQNNRTEQMLATMEKQQIKPIVYKPGEIPEIVALDKVLPPWISVRVDRTLYQHAVDQMFALVMALYKPPRGRRLVIDCLDMAATAPNSLGEWMHSARIVMDDYAKRVVTEAKVLLANNANWWTEARRLTYELGHGGHIWSVPVAIYTDDDGVTYKPYLLTNALRQRGEADMEIHTWFTDMDETRQHITLGGEMVLADPIDERHKEFYNAAQLLEMAEAATTYGPEPVPFADAVLDRVAPGDDAFNPCTHPNRGIVLTCDTDFLSLTVLWYARYCFLHRATEINCIDNAPLFSIGECQMVRTGWLQSHTDYFVKPKKRKAADALNEDGTEVVPLNPTPPQVITALEVWDVHRLWQMVSGAERAQNSGIAHLARVTSFAAFCALCGNDYLDGLAWVSRVSMFKAYSKLMSTRPPEELLITFDNENSLTAIVNPIVFIHLIKGCYWYQLQSLPGKTNKPEFPVDRMTYSAVARIMAAKYKDKKRHAPDDDRLALLYERLTWSINYALHGPQAIADILDDSVWGWPHALLEKRLK